MTNGNAASPHHTDSTPEQELKTLLEKFKRAQQIAKIGSWDWNLITNEVFWSDETYRIFEVSPDSYTPSYDSNAYLIHPDDR